jgi:membrane-associated phospholipid phosphatase
MDTLHRLDDQVLTAVNGFARHTPWLHAAVLGYATYGVALVAVLLLAGLWRNRTGGDRALAAAGWAGLAPLIALGLNQPLGSSVAERRPWQSHPGLLVLASHTSDFSFPSDHAVMAGAVAAGLLLVSRRLGLVAVAAALLMALSRVYIAAHYPWDVAVGLALGAAVAVLGWLLLSSPLTGLTAWLRARPAVRSVFAERPGAAEAPALSGRPAAADAAAGSRR